MSEPPILFLKDKLSYANSEQYTKCHLSQVVPPGKQQVLLSVRQKLTRCFFLFFLSVKVIYISGFHSRSEYNPINGITPPFVLYMLLPIFATIFLSKYWPIYQTFHLNKNNIIFNITMRIITLIALIFFNSNFIRAQIQGPSDFLEPIFTYCQCSRYSVQPPNPDMKTEYKIDSTGRTSVATQYMMEDSIYQPKFLDSFFYNSKQQIAEIRGYSFYNDLSGPPHVLKYTYSESGQVVSKKEFTNGLIRSEEYRRDQKGRPFLFISIYYKEDGSIDSEDNISFTFTNDTTALLKFFSNGKFIANGKHVYNRKYQILDEVIENPVTGKRVHFVWKYNRKGQLLSIHKEKVVVGDVLFSWSNHYMSLMDASRKLIYTYDSKGRLISKKIYMNIALDRVIEYIYSYEE